MSTVSYREHMLPDNATEFEKALSGANKRIQAIPAPIETVKRPYETPDAFIPFLAWERAVPIWGEHWDEQRKRNVVARSLVLHQKVGTEYALREYARFVDAEILDVVRPPQKVFSGPSLTREEREAWVASLPQVRVFTFNESGTAKPGKAFLGGSHVGRQHSPRFCLDGNVAPVPSDAISRMHKRAKWVVDGVEMDVRVTDFGSYYRLPLPAKVGLRVMSGRIAHKRYFIPSTAWKRLVTVQPSPSQPWRVPLTPTLDAVTAEPELVKVPTQRGRQVISDTPMKGQYFIPSTAAMRVFYRYAVLDGRPLQRRRACQIMGIGRYGVPKHTAYATVSVPATRNRFAAGQGITAFKRFWLPNTAPERVDTLRSALRSGKRLTDKVLLRLGPQRRFVAGGKPLLAGVDTLIAAET